MDTISDIVAILGPVLAGFLCGGDTVVIIQMTDGEASDLSHQASETTTDR